jgi:hypothetical protein
VVVRWGRHLDRGVGGAGRMVGRRPLGGRRSTSKRRPVEVDGREEDGEYEGGGHPKDASIHQKMDPCCSFFQ